MTIGSVILAVLIIAVLVARVRLLRGTTLIGPWCWTVLAICAVAVGETAAAMLPADAGSNWREPVKFAMAVIVFCPQMALLGAKRPQHTAWQFVVLTLWAVLVMPAFEVLLLRPGQSLDVHGLRSWFLALLILMGLANSLPTRFWLPALFTASGQVLLLWNYLPFDAGELGSGAVLLAMAAFLAAIVAAILLSTARRKCAHPLDRVWVDFRDWFGALWGLRLVDRVNSAGSRHDWPFTLTWNGFHARGESGELAISAAELEVLNTALTNMLRRFVSAEWIAKRMGESID